jgi:hypothetical protein
MWLLRLKRVAALANTAAVDARRGNFVLGFGITPGQLDKQVKARIGSRSRRSYVFQQ